MINFGISWMLKMSRSLFSALATHGICLCELNVVTITHLMTDLS